MNNILTPYDTFFFFLSLDLSPDDEGNWQSLMGRSVVSVTLTQSNQSMHRPVSIHHPLHRPCVRVRKDVCMYVSRIAYRYIFYFSSMSGFFHACMQLHCGSPGSS